MLAQGELITAVDLPPLDVAGRSRYRKVSDSASYPFALVSVAAALDVADGVVRDARIALAVSRPSPGGPGKPRRRYGARQLLRTPSGRGRD